MSVRMNYRIIGLNVSECRHERRLSQEQLAERAGICQQFLSRIERGKGVPSLETVMALCDALDVEPNRLLSRSATHDDTIPSRLRGSDGSQEDSSLIVIAPEDLPLLDLELQETDFDDFEA